MSSVSIVIPTLNAADRVGKLIEMLDAQTRKPNEILVADSASEDGTIEIARKLGVQVMYVDRRTFDHGATRHEAFLETQGDVVCFLTDDAIPANDRYIENLLAPLEDETVALVSGRQLPKPDARRFEQLVREYNYTSESNVRCKKDLSKYGIKTFFASDVCSAYRRDAYLECGGFERCRTNEDMLMAARLINAGYKVAYAADAEVYHSHNLSPTQQFKRNKAVGRFLKEFEDDFCGAGEIGEGAQLAKRIASQLIKERNITELFAFSIDCIARFAGNRAGRREAVKQSSSR